ncbi:MAG: hypothetical protein FJ100_13705 [Deltaproteobacteria bacterium]|nr:hypothetical protein [Deltaproteobacteria bacterium]
MITRTEFFASLAVLLGFAVSCGGPEVKPQPAGPAGPGADYAAQCSKAEAKRAADVAAKKYIEVELVLHQWPGRELPNSQRAYLKESELAAALTMPVAPGQPRVRTALVLARGGTGKSALAESLTAQACGKASIFQLDLNLDVVPLSEAGTSAVNPIAVVIAGKMGNTDPAQAEKVIADRLGAAPWVAVLDSLDETPLLSRDAIARHIDDLVTRIGPNARALVMTRPPVFHSNYGIATVDARLEIPQLTCEDSLAALGRYVPDPNDRKVVDEFVKRYGLDRQVTQFDRCHYPHMATYRDLQVVQKLAKNAASDAAGQDFKNFENSRAEVYRYFIKAQLIKDLQGVAMTPDDAIATTDGIVGRKNPTKGERNLPITIEDCVAAALLPDAGAKHGSCERLLQSSLFKGGTTAGQAHFANQSLGDLFLARWAAVQLRGPDGKADCRRLEGIAMMLESNEVAGFLVGQPEGQACLLPIAQAMCKRSGYADHVREQFDQGLPSGKRRGELVTTALDDLKMLPKQDACVSGLFDALAKTVDALPAPAPEAAPAPEPAKKGKGKKSK